MICGRMFNHTGPCSYVKDEEAGAGACRKSEAHKVPGIALDVKEEQAVKYDEGKTQWHLLPWDAMAELAKVFTQGAKKYEPRNWEKGMAWSRVYDSTMRHLTDWYQKRMTYDPDGTGLRNIGQAAWGCVVLLAWELRGAGTDDRPQVEPLTPTPVDDRPRAIDAVAVRSARRALEAVPPEHRWQPWADAWEAVEAALKGED